MPTKRPRDTSGYKQICVRKSVYDRAYAVRDALSKEMFVELSWSDLLSLLVRSREKAVKRG